MVGGWWRLAVVGDWWLVAVSSRRLPVGGGPPQPSAALCTSTRRHKIIHRTLNNGARMPTVPWKQNDTQAPGALFASVTPPPTQHAMNDTQCSSAGHIQLCTGRHHARPCQAQHRKKAQSRIAGGAKGQPCRPAGSGHMVWRSVRVFFKGGGLGIHPPPPAGAQILEVPEQISGLNQSVPKAPEKCFD